MKKRTVRSADRTPQLSLRKAHFDYTLVFGQGPVQETYTIPTTGEEGLNIFSQLIALAASEMLKQKITDNIIVSGGETGLRAGTPDASSEADLLADIIKRQLVSGQIFIAEPDKHIFVEKSSTSTFENFANILNTFIDSNEHSSIPSLAILGIGFHAHDMDSGNRHGRLGVMAEKVGVKAQVYSAEDVLAELLRNKSVKESPIKKTYEHIIKLPEYQVVSTLKSKQEKLLTQFLEEGDWVSILPLLNSEIRGRAIILNDAYVMNKLAETFSLTPEAVLELPYAVLVAKVMDLPLEGMKHTGYKEVKRSVFAELEAMSKKEGVDYFGRYAKGVIPDDNK